MRTLLFICLLPGGAAWGAEADGAATSTMREKLRVRILESLPPPAPPSPKPSADETDKTAEAVVMKPLVVSESKRVREVTAAIEHKEQERRDERFSPLEGGKIGTLAFMQVGGWWTPDEGWTFLRLNKTPTRRQSAATDARMKELMELQALGSGSAKPKP